MIKYNSFRRFSYILGIITIVFFSFSLVKALVDDKKSGNSYASLERYCFIGTGQVFKTKAPGSFSHEPTIVKFFKLTENSVDDSSSFDTLDGHYCVILNGNFNKDIPVNTDILFRLDNLALKMYVNGGLFYEYGNLHERPRFALSPGSVWETVNSGSSGISKNDEIIIELSNYYGYKAFRPFSLFISSLYPAETDFLLTPAIHRAFLSNIYSLMIVILGIVIIFMYFVLRFSKMKVPELYILGLFFFFSGLWFTVEYETLPFFIPFNSFVRILEIISMILMSSFFISYCCYYLKSIWKSILIFLVDIDFFVILIVLLLQFTGIYDIHENGKYLDFLVAYKMLFVIIAFVYESIKGLNRNARKLLLSFIPPAIISAVSSFLFNYVSLIGILKVVFTLFSIQQLKTVVDGLQTLINKNAEVKYLKDMAYRDVLTRVGNRNGYCNKVEQLEVASLSSEKKPLPFRGLAVFDINNLKRTNDLYGHKKGDTLIQNTAHIICKVFAHSPVFRVGGDEFVALLSPSDCLYIDILRQSFFDAVESFNNNNPKEITVSVAIGFAVSESDTKISFEEVFSRADKEMYNVKVAMKKELSLCMKE